MDKNIKCSDCNCVFVLTDAEQAWFKDKGFTEPKRCKNCRQKRKAVREAPAR